MSARKSFTVIELSFALSLVIAAAESVCAQDSFRLQRPTAAHQTRQPITGEVNSATTISAPLKANATVNTDNEKNSQPQSDAFALQSQQSTLKSAATTAGIAGTKQAKKPLAAAATGSSVKPALKPEAAVTAVAVPKPALKAATPVAAVINKPVLKPGKPMPAAMPYSPEPSIYVTSGHCPAQFDPAFKEPIKWWDFLAREEASPELGPQWKAWMSAATASLKPHAKELKATPGLASLHVIVDRDGSISDSITPYNGPERFSPDTPLNKKTMANLQRIIKIVGHFPPFPKGSKVVRYHLLITGAPNN